MTVELICEDDEIVYGNSGYLGIVKREKIRSDEHLSAIGYRISHRPGKLPTVSDNAIDCEHYIKSRKASARCKVEYLFYIIKNLFGYSKVVYQWLFKNLYRLYIFCTCANLYVLDNAGRNRCKA